MYVEPFLKYNCQDLSLLTPQSLKVTFCLLLWISSQSAWVWRHTRRLCDITPSIPNFLLCKIKLYQYHRCVVSIKWIYLSEALRGMPGRRKCNVSVLYSFRPGGASVSTGGMYRLFLRVIHTWHAGIQMVSGHGFECLRWHVYLSFY